MLFFECLCLFVFCFRLLFACFFADLWHSFAVESCPLPLLVVCLLIISLSLLSNVFVRVCFLFGFCVFFFSLISVAFSLLQLELGWFLLGFCLFLHLVCCVQVNTEIMSCLRTWLLSLERCSP